MLYVLPLKQSITLKKSNRTYNSNKYKEMMSLIKQVCYFFFFIADIAQQ